MDGEEKWNNGRIINELNWMIVIAKANIFTCTRQRYLMYMRNI
jgi:hypothetical protein